MNKNPQKTFITCSMNPFECRMSENQDIGDFLGTIESITCQLKDLDKAFDESVIMIKIICNLPAEYDNLMTALEQHARGSTKA